MRGKMDTLSMDDRVIYVYTPPSYDEKVEASFPVMIVQDGNNLFKDSLAELEADFMSGVTQEVIFVGLEPRGRHHEYTPWPATPLRESEGFNGMGDLYLQLVTEKVLPVVKEQEGIGRATLQQYMVPNTKTAYEILKEKIPGGSSNIQFKTDPDGVHDHSYFNRYFPHAMRFLYQGITM